MGILLLLYSSRVIIGIFFYHIQQQDNRTYESLLKSALDIVGLYYSTSYDLTHTLQRLYNTSMLP